jgi:hypothetical protein
MKLIFIALLFVQTTFHFTTTKVYICGTTGAKKYHYSENCRGLNACKHEIVSVALSEAQGYGLTLCGWED